MIIRFYLTIFSKDTLNTQKVNFIGQIVKAWVL